MRIDDVITDQAVLTELGARIARTRLERNWTQHDLAEAAGVGLSTLKRFEGGEGATVTNLIRILRALGLLEALERLIPEPAPSPVQQLRLAGRRRRRATGTRGGGSRRPRGEGGPWVWADETEA